MSDQYQGLCNLSDRSLAPSMSALDEKTVANGGQTGAAQSATPPDGQILTGKQEHCKWTNDTRWNRGIVAWESMITDVFCEIVL